MMTSKLPAIIVLLTLLANPFVFAEEPTGGNLQPQSWPVTFESWLAKVTGIDPKVYRTLARNRGATQRPRGTSLNRRDLITGIDQTLWQCGGCWSPILMSREEIAVIRDDGVWGVSILTKTPRQLIKAAGVREAVSAIADDSKWLLLVRTQRTGDCEYTTWRADIRSGVLERYGDSKVTCLLEFDFRSLIRPDQVRGDLILTTSEDDDPPLHVTKHNFSGTGESIVVLLPRRLAFDPIWLSDHAIAYIAGN
jgi:hypothetical protein